MAEERKQEAAEPPVIGSGSFDLPEGFAWDDPETWPVEFRQVFEYAAQIAYLGLLDLDKRMLDVVITGTAEPVTMIFAIGERASELRQAWRSVFAIHNDRIPREPAEATSATTTGPAGLPDPDPSAVGLVRGDEPARGADVPGEEQP